MLGVTYLSPALCCVGLTYTPVQQYTDCAAWEHYHIIQTELAQTLSLDHLLP